MKKINWSDVLGALLVLFVGGCIVALQLVFAHEAKMKRQHIRESVGGCIVTEMRIGTDDDHRRLHAT